jgi:predicted nicotinamide N-methyase
VRVPDSSYTRLQVPGLPGLRFRDQRLDLGGRTLELFSVSAVDLLSSRAPGELPYWCVAWPAGLGLARYLQRRFLLGSRVLEVGSGIGVAGLGAALSGGDVLLTDNVPAALRLAAMNARRNRLRVRAAAADWRAWPVRGTFDLVIGSDVTYEPAAFEALLSVLDRSLRAGGEVLLTDPGRLTAETFKRAALDQGWHWDAETLPHEGKQPVFLYRLRRLHEPPVG